MRHKLRPGEVLILRTCNADLTSYGGFQWPSSGPVAAPDWRPTNNCGHGLHGLLWGVGSHTYLNWTDGAKWLVVRANEADVRSGKGDLTDKCKFSHGEVVYCGPRDGAIAYMVERGADLARIVAGTATAGYAGTATAGDAGTATAGDAGTATAGSRGTATAGYAGTATAHTLGFALASHGGTVRAGDRGIITVMWWDDAHNRPRVTVGYVGEDGIKPDTLYRCDEHGTLVEVMQ